MKNKEKQNNFLAFLVSVFGFIGIGIALLFGYNAIEIKVFKKSKDEL